MCAHILKLASRWTKATRVWRQRAEWRACATVAASAELQPFLAALRELRPPYDADQLAALTTKATEMAIGGKLGLRQASLILYRFGELEWYTTDIAKAFCSYGASAVDELTPPEWIAMLRYFTGAGFHHGQLCNSVAEWARQHVDKLHLHHLEVLVTSLAHFRHIDDALGVRLAEVLDPLPPGGDVEKLLQIAFGLAVVGVKRPRLYHQVLEQFSSSSDEATPLLAGGDIRKAHLLLLLAKADATHPGLVLSLVRGVSPEAVRDVMPIALLPQLLRQLHRAALRQEAMLLDARPLISVLANASLRLFNSSDGAAVDISELAVVGAGLGFFGVEAPHVAEALWRGALTCDNSTAWRRAVECHETGYLRSFIRLAWSTCVLSRRHDTVRESLSGAYLQNVPSGDHLVALLGASPDLPGLQRVAQHMRQLAAVLDAESRHIKSSCEASAKSRSLALSWLQHVPRSPFFSRRRRVQERLMRALIAKLRCEHAVVAIPGDGTGAVDVIGVQIGEQDFQNSDVKMLAANTVDYAIWAKHPLLVATAEEYPEASVGGAATSCGCCLNGFEAMELRFGPVADVKRLVVVPSDASPDQLAVIADSMLRDGT